MSLDDSAALFKDIPYVHGLSSEVQPQYHNMVTHKRGTLKNKNNWPVYTRQSSKFDCCGRARMRVHVQKWMDEHTSWASLIGLRTVAHLDAKFF